MFRKIRWLLAERKLKNIIGEIEYAQASLEFYKGKLGELNQAKSDAELNVFF